MEAKELATEIFTMLYDKHVNGNASPGLYVGMQGDGTIAVIQPGGEHLAIVVRPATLGVT